MNIEQIITGLQAKFEKCRLVFWQDTDEEFKEELPALVLNTAYGIAQIINTDEVSHLEVKHRIELLEPETAFLLYSLKKPNEPTQDWLYDIRLYAEEFYADTSSMILNELGMNMEFRALIAGYKRFFTSKQRRTRLKKMLPKSANEKELELAMMSVVLKVEHPTLSNILLNLFTQQADDVENKTVLIELEKFNLTRAFWGYVYEEHGYLVDKNDSDDERKPTIQDLWVKLLFTDCYQSLVNSGCGGDENLIDGFSAHLLPLLTKAQQEAGYTADRIGMNSSRRAHAVSFVVLFRESRTTQETYNTLANHIEHTYELKNKLSVITSPRKLLNVNTFQVADKQLLVLLAKQLHNFELEEVNAIVTHRLTTHWCHVTSHAADTNYACLYKAIKAAKQFYTLKNNYIDGFNFNSAKELYRAYEQELFLFDKTYREFCTHAHHAAHHGSDVLKRLKLVEDIEDQYVNWYLHDLAIAWGQHIDKENFLEKWKMDGVWNQYNFYRDEINQIFQNTQIKRVFVIISDALRYEVAHEIHEQINKEQRFKSSIKSQLGVVPSYTPLGMAALLPHFEITAHIGKDIRYKADGLSVHGLDNRNAILNKHHGIAVKSEDVLNWTNEEGRKAVANARVVYIYHDQIDAIGDKAATENQTFHACSEAIIQIKMLVERIINKLNGNRIFITADHGFLFKTSDVVDSDKTALAVKPHGALETKKRYLIGQQLPSNDFSWTGNMAITANLSAKGDQLEFMVPRGSNRFNFLGGAKFIHGGIMPQEICVPVLRVEHLKTTKQKASAKQKVGVVPLCNGIRLVTLTDKIEFLQTNPVGDKFKERNLEFWIEDPEGNIVSTKTQIMFNSSSASSDDRCRSTIITLNGTGFDRTFSYRLVMWDTEQGDKYATHTVTIDLAIQDDFDDF